MPDNYAIQTENLRKVYGDKTAVNQLNLTVHQGEIFGFLGPNGAGKTTSIKMLLGLTSTTSGTAHLLGKPAGNPAVCSKIGFLPEHFRFHQWLTASEFLTLHGRLFGMEAEVLKKRISLLLDRVKLTAFQNKQLKTFSKGMLQRIGLAQALLNEPKLVFLDEPTSGLDPVGRRLVRDIIHELRGEGASVFLNSHFLSEVEITCDRVAFIKEGEIVKTLELNSFTEGQVQVIIRASGWQEEILAGLESFGRDIRMDAKLLSMVIENENLLPQITRYLVDKGVDIFAITPQRISLEEYFIQIVGTEGVL